MFEKFESVFEKLFMALEEVFFDVIDYIHILITTNNEKLSVNYGADWKTFGRIFKSFDNMFSSLFPPDAEIDAITVRVLLKTDKVLKESIKEDKMIGVPSIEFNTYFATYDEELSLDVKNVSVRWWIKDEKDIKDALKVMKTIFEKEMGNLWGVEQ